MADPPGGRVKPSSARAPAPAPAPSGGSTSSQSHTSFKKGVSKVRQAKKAEEQQLAAATGQENQQPIESPIKRTRKETEERIEGLLKRLQRQFSSQRPSEQKSQVPPRPPDQAAATLGRELANAFLQTLDYPTSDNSEFEGLRQKTLQCLTNCGIHPSVPHAFFAELTSDKNLPNNDDNSNRSEFPYEDWLPDFILQLEILILEELPNNSNNSALEDAAEASGLHETLAAAIKAYAIYSAKTGADDEVTSSISQKQKHDLLKTTYRRLQTSAARTMLLREFSRSIHELSAVRSQLSPLMAACVLTAWSTPHCEKTFFLQELFRQVWDVIYATDEFESFWDILFWMTEALNIFLLVLPSAARNAREQRPAWRELAQNWLMELGDMLAFVVHASSNEDGQGRQSSERLLAEWLQVVLNNILPMMSLQGTTSYRLSLEQTLEQLNGLIVEMDDSLLQLNTMVVFRLSTMAMATPLKGETRCILALFSYLLPSESAFARGLTSALGSIYLQDETCHAAAKHLLKTAQGIDQQLLGISDRNKTTNIVQLLEDGENGHEVLEFIAKVDTYALENLSAVKQLEALLLGISMMEIINHEKLQEMARSFLKHLIRRYQHLGMSLLPALLEDINASAVEQAPEELLAKLEFLCDSVMVDPSCAQQAWNLLGVQMLESHNPVALRVTILRLLPRLVVVNKRLYRRVIDTLGVHREGKPHSEIESESLTPDRMKIQPSVVEIRVAVAASIADLAKEDLIRDPADCVGWIQEFLVVDHSESPMNALLVHYAILTLHYLVIAQELDFNLVLKVLKKKLCNVSNIDEVQQLPPVVLEALALLLGDGDCKSGSSSEDDVKDGEDGAKSEVPEISPQVVGAVQVLVDIGFQFEDGPPSKDVSNELSARIRRNVYYSLSNYSLDCLGLDEDGVKAALEEGNAPAVASRYIALRHLAVEGLRIPLKMRELVDDFDAAVEAFNVKMLRFEEEVLSANLWATKGTRHHAVPQRKGDSYKAAQRDIMSLPAATKVQAIHRKKPSTASSISWLLCFEGKPLSKFLSLAGDVSFEDTEAIMNVFLVQGWLHASSRLLSQLSDGNKLKGLSQTVEDIRRWGDHSGHLDAVYLTLASMCVYIARSGDQSDCIVVDKMQGEVWNGFKGLMFLNSDIGKIAIALTAVSAMRFGSHERVNEISEALEQSVKGYGGQISFGACYGISMIVQAISQLDPSDGNYGTLKSKIGNLTGFLVRELLACTEPLDENADILTTLVACLQSGVSTPGLVASLAESVSNQFSLIAAKQETARYLFICLGLCLPSLSQVNGDLLLGTLFLLEKFQWGNGKGIALVPVLAEAKASGVLTNEEYDVIISEYARVFEQGLGGPDVARQQDLFYAVNATGDKPSPHVMRQFLTRTGHVFDDHVCTSPLVAALVSIGTFPCLGFGTKTLTDSAQPRTDMPNVTINAVLDIVLGAVDAHTDNSKADFSRNAVAVLGLLSSMQKAPVDLRRLSPAKERVATPSSRLKMLDLDFKVLPAAQQGTLLFEILQLIQQAHKSEKYAELKRFIGCLECLSLPGHFAKHFLEPLISENDDDVKEACVSLLAAQIIGRRKAIFDGRDFANMALQISIMPLVSWNNLLGEGKASTSFVRCLEGVVNSLPSELIESGCSNLWEICLSLSGDNKELVIEFLKSLRSILRQQKRSKQSKMSPKTKKYLEHFVITRVFSDLREAFSWGSSDEDKIAAGEDSIVGTYISCLSTIPLESLEQQGFFSYQEDDGFAGEAMRSLVILELVRIGYVTEPQARSVRISKILAWFVRKLAAPGTEEYSDSLRRMSCSLAATSKVLSLSERQNHLLSIFEQLLLCQCQAYPIALDLLSVVVSSWCGDVTTDGDLSMIYFSVHSTEKLNGLSDAALGQVFDFLRHDLPFNLATYGRLERISAILSNQIWRLIVAWSKHDADGEVVRALRKAFICGSNGETKEEDFASLTNSILLESDFFHTTLLR